jgi:hypothetical protein
LARPAVPSAPAASSASWSPRADLRFTARLRRMGFLVEEVAAGANGRRGGARHTVWIATQG